MSGRPNDRRPYDCHRRRVATLRIQRRRTLASSRLGTRFPRSGGCNLIRRRPTVTAMDETTETTVYEFRVRGLMSDRLLGAFPEMHARLVDHETVLNGALPDQSALHGVLGRIESLGLELLEVRRPTARAEARHRTRPTSKAERTADVP